MDHIGQFPFFESIRLLDGQFHLLEVHENRIRQARAYHGQTEMPVGLEQWLLQFACPQQGLFKCRLSYGASFEAPQFIPYIPKPIRSLKLVTDNQIEYTFKRNNRQQINHLYQQRHECDDVLIVRNGKITDTSYCNIVFFDGHRWFTPDEPLLQGVQRAFLLQNNKIHAATIHRNDLNQFVAFRLINALIPWENAAEISIDAIH